jgi:hypothetical protein
VDNGGAGEVAPLHAQQTLQQTSVGILREACPSQQCSAKFDKSIKAGIAMLQHRSAARLALLRQDLQQNLQQRFNCFREPAALWKT